MVMQVATLDILTTKGHFTPEVARAIGEAMDLEIERSREAVATSQQLADVQHSLRAEIAEFRHEIKAELAKLRLEVKAALAELRTELKTEIAELRTEMRVGREKTKAELVRWVFVVAIGQLGAIAGIIRFLGPHGP
jgi:ribosomal protein L29